MRGAEGEWVWGKYSANRRGRVRQTLASNGYRMPMPHHQLQKFTRALYKFTADMIQIMIHAVLQKRRALTGHKTSV